jgi:hypothetical protein
MCINRSNVGSVGVVLCRSSTLPSHSRNQRSLRLTTMIGRRPVTYYYSPKCPAAGCSEAAWKRLNKCRGRSKEESVEKLKHHLHASKLHYMGKPEAEELAESYDGWLYHDTDEEDVPPGLDAPSVNSGAPLTECRYRSLTPARQGPIALRRSRSAPRLRRHLGKGVAAGIAVALLLQMPRLQMPRCLRVLMPRWFAYSYPSSPPFVQHDTHSDLACLLQTPSTERQ